MKINFTLTSLARSGGTRVVLEVANQLARRGYQSTITTMTGKPTDLHWFPNNDVQVLYPSMHTYVESSSAIDLMIKVCFNLPRFLGRRRAFEIDFVHKLSKLIPECDVNIATYWLTAFAVHRSGRGVPFYYVQHHEPLLFDDTYRKKLAEETYYLPLKCIAVSTWLKDLLHKKYSKDSDVCLNGVDRRVFYPRESTTQDDVKHIMCVGRNAPWKGMQDLVRAMNIVYERHPMVQLTIAAQEKIKVTEAQFPFKIVRAPTDDDVARLYSQSNVFVTPSWYEGFSLPNLEAMSCGTPVVTTRYGTEDYAVDRENAIVVPPHEPKQIAVAILDLLSDAALRDRLIKNGIKTAQKLSWKATADKFEEIIRTGFEVSAL